MSTKLAEHHIIMTNPTLVEFVKNQPVQDMRSAIRCVVVYDRCDHDPDKFCLDLMEQILWERKSPLKFLYEMSNLYDQTESVAFASCFALRYLSRMFADPGILWEGYTESAFLNEFVEILHRDDCTLEWLVRLDAVLIYALDEVSMALKSVLQILRTSFLSSSFQNCVGPLILIQKLFVMKSMRMAFCDDPKCAIVLRELFQKGVLPWAGGIFGMQPNQEYVSLYGRNPIGEMTSGTIEHVGTLYDVYYGILAKILKELLTDRKDTVLAFIQAMIEESYNAEHVPPHLWGQPLLLATNVESVLIRITCENLRLENIDPLTPYLPSPLKLFIRGHGPLAVPGIKSWISEYNQDRFLEDEGVEKLNEEWQSFLQQPHKEPLLISYLFFASVMMMKTTVCFFRKAFEELIGISMRMEDPAKKQAWEFEASFFRWAYCYPKKRDQLVRMVTSVIDFMLETGKYSPTAKVFETEIPPVFYQRLPEAFGEVASTVVTFLLELNELKYYPEFITRLSALFHNPHYLPNPNTRKMIVHFFGIMAKKPSETARYVITTTVLQTVFPAVVEFYSQVQNTGTDDQWYQRIGIRLECVKLLRFWFRFDEPKEYFHKNFSREENRDFLFFLVSDTTTHLNKVMDACMHNHVRKDDAEDWGDSQDFRDELRAGVKFGKQWLNLLDSISCFAPEAFSAEGVVVAVPTLILSYFAVYKDRESMRNNSVWEQATRKGNVSKFDFLYKLALIACRLSSNEAILKNLIRDDLRYSDDLFTYICQELRNNPKLSSDFFEMFSELINKTSALKKQDEPDEFADLIIPEEFRDELTYDLLKDPWTLPSGRNVSKESLWSLKLSGCLDPMTLEPFRMEDCKPNPELKARIDAWIEEQRRQRANH